MRFLPLETHLLPPLKARDHAAESMEFQPLKAHESCVTAFDWLVRVWQEPAGVAVTSVTGFWLKAFSPAAEPF